MFDGAPRARTLAVSCVGMAGGGPCRASFVVGSHRRKENIEPIRGLQEYVRGRTTLSDKSLREIEARHSALQTLVELQPEAERYRSPHIDLPTDDDNSVPSTIVRALRVLERAKFDLARRVAAARGFRPGDEIVVESRDALGDVTPSPVC